MTYFKNITSYEELKKQYRTLATTNHPDVGGTTEAMQAINSEYDMLFPIWKIKNKITTSETAYSTRSEFYTQNGWKGENYSSNLRTKEITKILRDAIKIMYPLCKFSVSFDSFSGGSSIKISLMEAPYNVFVSDEAITTHYIDGTTKVYKHIQINNYYIDSDTRMTEQCKAMFKDIDSLVKSYRYDDSDSMIDYFHTNFYYDLNIGKWNKEFEVVGKTARIGQKANCKDKGIVVSEQQETTGETQSYTYDIKQDVDTRDNSTIFVVKIIEKLSKEEYVNANIYMKSVGSKGYSRFKHGFLFVDDPTELLNGEQTAATTAKSEPIKSKTKEISKQNNEVLTQKISKQIDSNNAKIEKLSGNYQTNTYKRMREQDSRDSKVRGYQLDNDMLNYLLNRLDDEQPLTTLENALITGSFRSDIHSKHNAHNRFMSEKYSSDIKYPSINPEWEKDHWYNIDVPKQQKRLNIAGITNTKTLIEAVEQYGKTLEIACKPVDQTAQKIKKLERECKMMQKGDINFTPTEIAQQLVELARIDANSTVLEPSAGIGAIADQIRQVTQHIDVVECMSSFRELLQLKGYNLVGDDFLQYQPEQKYDAIIMNPPFSDEQKHIKHAYSMLEDGGSLVSISSPHWTFANDKKSVEFRNWLEQETYYTQDLVSGTFEMTNVSSKIIVIEKREQGKEQTA